MSKQVNINQASVDALADLPGIGKSLAGRIVAHRETIGTFTNIQQLAQISGISARMVTELAEYLTLNNDEENNMKEIDNMSEVNDKNEVPKVNEAEVVPVEETSAVGEEAEDILSVSDEPTSPEPIEPAAGISEPEPMPITPSFIPSSSPPPTMSGDTIGGFDKDTVSTALLGAALGSIVTVILLLLFVAPMSRRFRDMERVVEQVQNAQVELQAEMDSLSSNVNDLLLRADRLETGLSTLDSVTENRAMIEQLQADTSQIEEDIANVVNSAEDLDTFLDMMSNVLIDLRSDNAGNMEDTTTEETHSETTETVDETGDAHHSE